MGIMPDRLPGSLVFTTENIGGTLWGSEINNAIKMPTR